MSTAQVAAAALELSELRQRLNRAAGDAWAALHGGNDPTRRAALERLLRTVDDTVDDLHPFAFYTNVDMEQFLGFCQAVAAARGGDVTGAGEQLVAVFHVERKAA